MITTFTLAYIFNPEHSINNGRFYVFESYQKYTFTKTYKITKTTTAHLSNDYCSSVVKYCIGGPVRNRTTVNISFNDLLLLYFQFLILV